MDLKLFEDGLVEAIGRAVTSVTRETLASLEEAKKREEGAAAVQLEAMLKSIEVSDEEKIPICQDTGIPTFFIQVGSKFPEIHEIGSAIVNAVRRATEEVPLRPNTVHPIKEENPGDNTGAYIPYIDWEITDGEELRIIYLPKGGGSENMSQLVMMAPGRGLKGVKEIVLDRIASMEGKPCPPTVVGVGLGGGANIAMNLAKKALLRPIGVRHPEKEISELEEELKGKANELGVGPMGVGGKTTVLDVKIEYAHRHPASYPVGIIPQCWCNRRSSVSVKPDGSMEVIE